MSIGILMDENLRDQEFLNFYFTKEGLEDCTQLCLYSMLEVRYRDQNHKFNFTMSQFISRIFTFVLNSTMLLVRHNAISPTQVTFDDDIFSL